MTESSESSSLLALLDREAVRAHLLRNFGEEVPQRIAMMIGGLLSNVEPEDYDRLFDELAAGKTVDVPGHYGVTVMAVALAILGADLLRPVVETFRAELAELGGYRAYHHEAQEVVQTCAGLIHDGPRSYLVGQKDGRRLLFVANDPSQAARRYASLCGLWRGEKLAESLDVERVAFGPNVTIAPHWGPELDGEDAGSLWAELSGSEVFNDGSTAIQVLDTENDIRCLVSYREDITEEDPKRRAVLRLRNGCGDGVPLSALLALALHQAKGLGDRRITTWLQKAKATAEQAEQTAD